MIAKKSLGQHFLHDARVIHKIVASLNLDSKDGILEIGCGTGALTAHLAGRVSQFVGVELDRTLFEALCVEFRRPGTRFLNQDILTLELEGLFPELPPRQRIKVVGNLPYYISSPIVDWLGSQSSWFESATIMLQTEVADRLLAEPGSREYGVLTVTALYHFLSRRLFAVKAPAFRPIPKVDSAVVRLEPKAIKPLELESEPEFFNFVKRCFSARRKMLRNCLKGRFDQKRLELCLASLDKPGDVRAEALSLEDFVSLFAQLRVP
jgi:16S rRNA (adenine1518-N6/adenine1519-N6)-dimethyltransferase